MKYPQAPLKPFAPYKPRSPPKQITQIISLGKLHNQTDCVVDIQWFVNYINEKFPGIDPSKVKIRFDIEDDYDGYKDLTIEFYTENIVDNPNYNKIYEFYKKELEKYNIEYEKYKQKLNQFKIDEKKYEEDLELYNVDRAKEIIEKHERKSKNK